uniref:non-specific serine/threonine protein kinase n=1 Tax=Gasterosteus aculeatus aculeatus TaxID=481459 RepID=G3PMV6_GASAC
MSKIFMERHGYTFISNLGEGVFGKVVSAYSTKLRKRVAIKIIDRKKFTSVALETFLRREMEIIKPLNHPNIVYVVMDLCVKGDLLKHINAEGALPEDSACRLFTQLCNAVQYLHKSDVAHRDLKCENMLLDTHFNLRVCDFGFSKKLTYADGRMILSKTFCGTSSYAAPEILRSLPYNPKVSDVWSMGVILFMMLFASMPFDDTSIRRMSRMQIQHEINFPTIRSVSSDAKDLIHRILHPVVEDRITISNIEQSSWMKSAPWYNPQMSQIRRI